MHYIVLKNPRPDAEDELIYLLTNMAIAVLVYILAIREGLLKECRDGIRWVRDKASGFEYRAVSVFLKGMDIVRRKALNLAQFIRYLRKITNGQYASIFQNI
ncbi:MAG: hypothetical protein AAFO02_18460 [Bacteroidota bacterium]